MGYTAVVLDDRSREALRDRFRDELPPGWEVEADHMTVNLGPAEEGPAKGKIGQQVELKVNSLARGRKVIAVGVESPVPTGSGRPHITLAVDREEGGEPEDSNELTDWKPVEPLTLHGTVREVG